MDELIKKLISFDFQTWLLVLLIVIVFTTWIFNKIKNSGDVSEVSTPLGFVKFRDNIIKKKKSPHSGCVHAKDVVKVLQHQRTNIRESDRIEMLYIPRDLMNRAEDEVDSIVAEMEAIFLDILKNKEECDRNITTHPAFESYQKDLSLVKRDILKKVLRMVRENHFSQRDNEGTFEKYKRIKTENIMHTVTDRLNKYYKLDDPSREEVHNVNMKVLENGFRIRSKLSNVLEEMKETAKMYECRIKHYEDEIDEKIENLFL